VGEAEKGRMRTDQSDGATGQSSEFSDSTKEDPRALILV
jgi:hypothetical protein